MVIHDRSIDKRGKLVEGDVSIDEDRSVKIYIHNTDNAKELFRIIYIHLSENVIKDFIK